MSSSCDFNFCLSHHLCSKVAQLDQGYLAMKLTMATALAEPYASATGFPTKIQMGRVQIFSAELTQQVSAYYVSRLEEKR